VKKGLKILEIIIGSLILISSYIIYKSYKLRHNKFLPIYGSRSIDTLTHDTIYHQVLNFRLTDQMGQIVTLDTFHNKIYAANFFFASCPGICKIMNNELEIVAKHFAGNPNVKFISYTVTPDQDSVPVLAEYAKLHDAVPYQWYFVTGDKKEIINQARFSYDLITDKYLVHSQNITLIDRDGHIRGVYGGTISEEINRLINDIEVLLKEDNKRNIIFKQS
jgi:protein SCO1